MILETLRTEFSIELQLLLACCQITPRKDKIENISQLLKARIDWNKFLYFTDYHRLDPIVYNTLKNPGLPGIPDHTLAALKKQHTQHTLQMMKLSAELVHLLKHFKDKNIKALPLKGPILALQVYKNINCRRSTDLDILVSREDFQRAEFHLERMGYRLSHPFCLLSEKKIAFVRKDSTHLPYTHLEKNIRIELHWSPSRDPFFSIQSIWPHLEEIRFADYSVPVMDENNTFYFLCQHGTKHNWRRLFWLQDIAVQLNDKHGLNNTWPEFFDNAKQNGVERCVAEGVYLSHYLFGTDLPKTVETFANKDKAVHQLISHSLKIINSPGFYIKHFPFYRIKRNSLITRNSKNSFTLLLKTFIPGVGDFQTVNLPDKFIFMYYFLRPFFVFQRKWTAARKLRN